MWPFGDSKIAAPNESQKPSADASIDAAPPTRAELRAARRIARNEQADLEFAEFVRSLETPTRQDKTIVPPTPAVGGIVPPVTKPAEPKPNYEPQVYEDGTIDIRPDVLHPRAMNCRQQFDQAFYCQSLGGKFNDIYRYGEFRSCSEQWNAFWFCMRTRTLGDDAKAAQTMDYYRDRDLKRRKQFGSSEDVWDIRTRSVKRAFWKDPDGIGKEEVVKE